MSEQNLESLSTALSLFVEWFKNSMQSSDPFSGWIVSLVGAVFALILFVCKRFFFYISKQSKTFDKVRINSDNINIKSVKGSIINIKRQQ